VSGARKGEDCFWDFEDEDYASWPALAPPRHHPENQPVPERQPRTGSGTSIRSP